MNQKYQVMLCSEDSGFDMKSRLRYRLPENLSTKLSNQLHIL